MINQAATKTSSTADALRAYLVTRDLTPGDRLPSISELEARFAAGRTVVQQAIGILRDEGFLETVDRRGVFVTQRPPHLTRLAIAFGSDPKVPDANRFVQTMYQTATAGARPAQGYDLVVYGGVGDPAQPPFQRLRADAVAHRLAGILFLGCPHDVTCAPSLAALALPRVQICPIAEDQALPAVRTHGHAFWHMAYDHLRARGCRHIAVIATANRLRDAMGQIRDEALAIAPDWVQGATKGLAVANEQLVHLLFRTPANERPDGLIIADDNLEPDILRALLRLGLEIDRDVTVVAHCNWPAGQLSPLPIAHLGYGVPELLNQAIAMVTRLLADPRTACPDVLVDPSFQPEPSSHFSELYASPVTTSHVGANVIHEGTW